MGSDHRSEAAMMSLNCKDLGMDLPHHITGADEREVMRNFISYAETELHMPVLTADTIYRVRTMIKTNAR